MPSSTKNIQRIAMWSTPRSLSTVLMRAWGNRPDTTVLDEPFNVAYLESDDVDIQEYQNRNWNDIATVILPKEAWQQKLTEILTPPPTPYTICYQKHMAAYIPPDIPLDWTHHFTNCFLIRNPKKVIHSYLKAWPVVNQLLLGFPNLLNLFHYTKNRIGSPPPVIDAKDLQMHPKQTLERLCEAVNIEFSESMLHWKKGIQPTDGPWTARNWYQKVAQTTTFRPYQPKHIELEAHLMDLWEECEAVYQELLNYKL